MGWLSCHCHRQLGRYSHRWLAWPSHLGGPDHPSTWAHVSELAAPSPPPRWQFPAPPHPLRGILLLLEPPYHLLICIRGWQLHRRRFPLGLLAGRQPPTLFPGTPAREQPRLHGPDLHQHGRLQRHRVSGQGPPPLLLLLLLHWWLRRGHPSLRKQLQQCLLHALEIRCPCNTHLIINGECVCDTLPRRWLPHIPVPPPDPAVGAQPGLLALCAWLKDESTGVGDHLDWVCLGLGLHLWDYGQGKRVG